MGLSPFSINPMAAASLGAGISPRPDQRRVAPQPTALAYRERDGVGRNETRHVSHGK